MKLRTLSLLKSVKNKRILLRVDFNVPLEDGRIAPGGDERIKATLPTIKRLIKAGAKIIIVSHLGRPEGWQKEYSLAPVWRRLEELLGKPVLFVSAALDDGKKVDAALDGLQAGGPAMLENIRFYKGEEKNSAFLSRRLASLADLFVNEAFATMHRAHASTAGVAKFLPSFSGLLVEKEVKNLQKVLDKPSRPFVALLGGAKLADKLPTVDRLSKIADQVLIGGGMANSFFKAKGFSVGKSSVSAEDVRLAKKLLKRKNIALPKDVLAADSLSADARVRVTVPGEIRLNEYVVDIGTLTMREYAFELKKAKTIVWNGPVGLFEIKKFSHGSVVLARVVASRSSGKAYGVAGGGETVACLERTGMAEYVDHVSTGGGAMLDFLAGKELPGLKPLYK